MTYKTVESYVEIEVDLDEWDDNELAEEMRERGWFVSQLNDGVESFQREEFDLLLSLVDSSNIPLYAKSTLREKLLGARFQDDTTRNI